MGLVADLVMAQPTVFGFGKAFEVVILAVVVQQERERPLPRDRWRLLSAWTTFGSVTSVLMVTEC